MRNLAVLSCIVMMVALNGLQVSVKAEGTPDGSTTVNSSLAYGDYFERDAKIKFETQLSTEERKQLVALQSRYELADISIPTPSSKPTQPFYLKLRADMTRELASTLKSAGCSFIGYANAHTHFIRAKDSNSLLAIRNLIENSPLVVGTILQHEADMMSHGMYSRFQSGADMAGAYSVLFWRDLTVEQMVETLESANALIVEGNFSGSSPLVTVQVNNEGAQVLRGHQHIELLDMPTVLVATNVTSTSISNADAATIGIHPYGLDGSGEIAGVWDEGPGRESHLDYQTSNSLPSGWGSSSRVWDINQTTLSDHGAHVAGTIVGDGSGHQSGISKGYAPEALLLAHRWNNVDNERRSAYHEWSHAADNHSYSTEIYSTSAWGSYNGGAQRSDLTNRDILVSMVQSAGNEGVSKGSGTQTADKPWGNSNPTQSIGPSNGHRNAFIAANAQDNLTLRASSSCGPAADGRLQPQFCANGTTLTSSISTADDDYGSKTGTSMSAPSICGSLVLLSQLWKKEHNDQHFTADIARAVVAQTCDDQYHAGPDYHFGFGIVNCKAAADLILEDKASGGNRIIRGTARSGSVREYAFTSNGIAPLHMVLGWLDVFASTNASVLLVNNLDIELVDPNGVVHYPYSGVTTVTTNDHAYAFTTTGSNTRDNIEMVHVDNPTAGIWRLRVLGTSIPANPQTNMPNDACGWVVASSHELAIAKIQVEDSLNGSTPVNIPDNNNTGITRTINVNDNRYLTSVRLHVRLKHERRGDVAIQLEHPDGTIVNLKTSNNHSSSGGGYDLDSQLDVIAIFPDTKQTDDDVTTLLCKPVNGAWKIHFRDTISSNTGYLEYLMLEIDVRSNANPIADAGSDFAVLELNSGQLNAVPKPYAEGLPLTYSWVQTAGTAVTLSDPSSPNPTFAAHAVAANEVLTFMLTVEECPGYSATDSISVTIENNVPPKADAGWDQGAIYSTQVTLDGSKSSDPNTGDSIASYSWVQISGTANVVLTGAGTDSPTFISPTTDDVLIFELTVTDGAGNPSTDRVAVHINTNGLVPKLVRTKKSNGGGCSLSASSSSLWLLLGLVGCLILFRRRSRGYIS